MNQFLKKGFLYSLAICFSTLMLSCEEDEVAAPIQVNFANEQINISESQSSATIEVVFSRPAEAAGTVSLNIGNSSLTYGEQNDFYTTPAAEDNVIAVPFNSGDASIEITVAAGEGLNIQADAEVTFELVVEADNYLAGNTTQMILTFSENFVAASGSLTLNAGGPEFSHVAFADLSKLTASSFDKYSWDLSFTSGESFHVLVNNAANVMARPLDESITDLTTVNAEDTVGFSSEMTVPQFDASTGAANWIDDQSGNLEATAFGAIAADASSAKIFIVKRDNGEWKKVKVYQSANGYIIEHANINSDQVSTTAVAKDTEGKLVRFNFEEEIVTDLPANWDIMYSSYANRYPFGATAIPYGFSDYITLNPVNTSAYEVVVENDATAAFNDFTLNDVKETNLTSAINIIGSNWRNGGGPSSAPSLKDDRFYVLADSQGNYYKLQFTGMYDGNDERGSASFNFVLLNE